mmetsp:Transcript_10456/g.63912  ORF Transcript_10456/g.63912 Transcript_10456/m.63912 type:complete len:218 (-) Transcript_10456:300-953(-)
MRCVPLDRRVPCTWPSFLHDCPTAWRCHRWIPWQRRVHPRLHNKTDGCVHPRIVLRGLQRWFCLANCSCPAIDRCRPKCRWPRYLQRWTSCILPRVFDVRLGYVPRPSVGRSVRRAHVRFVCSFGAFRLFRIRSFAWLDARIPRPISFSFAPSHRIRRCRRSLVDPLDRRPWFRFRRVRMRRVVPSIRSAGRFHLVLVVRCIASTYLFVPFLLPRRV